MADGPAYATLTQVGTGASVTGAPHILARGEGLSSGLCGNGVINGDEECDDSNNVGGDGCASNCRAEVCGNGQVDVGEACDDGNAIPSDGCTGCAIDPCGNGVLEPGEECDDGNNRDGDGCNSACIVVVCGDGTLQGSEACDDGNTASGDGCSNVCALECGNGVADAGEECDDSNTADGDGCSSVCLLEICGNGRVDGGEGCDDGNTVNGDGCSSTCEPGYADVLIVGSTMYSNADANQAAALGLTYEVVTDTQMRAMTTAHFRGHRAIIFGDPYCSGAPPAVLGQTRLGWGPAITGNVLIYGGDPTLHSRHDATKGFIKYVAGGPTGTTGLYVALSCYGGTTYPWLDQVFGNDFQGHFTPEGGSYDAAKITSAHPALEGLTEAVLSGWSQATVRECVVSCSTPVRDRVRT